MTLVRDDLSHQRGGRARKAILGVLWSGLNALLPAASGMVIFLLASRVISPAEFGLVAFATTVVGIVGAFTPAGFGDALIQREDLDEGHLDATFWLCLVWGAALYLGLVLSAPALADMLGEPALRALLPVIGARLVFDLAGVVPTALLSRTMRFRRIATRTMAVSALSMAVCLAVLHAGYGLWALVFSQLVSSVVACVVSWLSIGWRPRLRLGRAALGDLARFGSYASGSRLLTTINVEQFVVGALLGSAALGLFAFARRIFALLTEVLTGALQSVSYPLLSSMQSEPAKLREAYLATTLLSSLLAFPIFVGLALTADTAIPLVFGEQWRGAVPALRAFCAIGLLSCVGVLQAALIRARGGADWWMWYMAAKQGVIAVVIVAVAHLGTTAVAVAVAVATWAIWPVTTLKVARLIDLPLPRYLRRFLPPLFGCVVMTAAVLAFRHGVDLPGALASRRRSRSAARPTSSRFWPSLGPNCARSPIWRGTGAARPRAHGTRPRAVLGSGAGRRPLSAE